MPTAPVLLIAATFSRYREALDWAAQVMSESWGSIALATEPMPFTETDYYQPTMGPGLLKKLIAFEPTVDPATLPDRKHQAIAWERQYAALGRHAEPRPLNIDPGYVTLAKLVLASTKDHAHRLYLGQDIYGEVTLFYRDRRWQCHEWTFPDYRRADYHEFFDRCRRFLKEQWRSTLE